MLTKIKHFILLFFISSTLVQAQDNPVHIKLSNKKVSACEYDLIFTASIDEPWHMYSLNKLADDGPNPTVFTFIKSKEYEKNMDQHLNGDQHIRLLCTRFRPQKKN